jgi:hypothetical protein
MKVLVVAPDFKTFAYSGAIHDGRIGNCRFIVGGLKLLASENGVAMREEVDVKLRH